jgi:hypothetical protein
VIFPVKTKKVKSCIAVVLPRKGTAHTAPNYVWVQGIRAHRLSFKLNKGPLKGKLVLHTCNNKWCINPDHLYLGGKRENFRDMMQHNGNAYRAKCSASHIARFKDPVREKQQRVLMRKAANIRWSDPAQRAAMSKRLRINNPMKEMSAAQKKAFFTNRRAAWQMSR